MKKLFRIVLIFTLWLSLGSLPARAVAGVQSSSATAAPSDAFHQPAEFVVTQTAANANPGAFTTTMPNGPVNTLLSGGAFEPMVFRQKFYVPADSPNQLALQPSDVTGWDVYREGFYDGATARVYRVVGGKLVQVRTDSVPAGGSRASGWWRQIDGALYAPQTVQLDYRFDNWERPDVPYYFMLTALDSNGNESPASNWVSAANSGLNGAVHNTSVPFSPPAQPGETTPPAAPANLAVSSDSAADVLHFSWEAVDAPDLAGYRLYRSDVIPSAMRGFGIDFATVPTDPAQYLRKGDIVFLDQVRTRWSRAQFNSNRVWGDFPSSGQPPLVPFQNDEVPGGEWDFVPHPQPLPADFGDPGATCLRVQIPDDGKEYSIFQFNHAGTWQDWYPVLTPGQTYAVEVWMRQDGMSHPKVRFQLGSFYGASIPPVDFTVDGSWKHFKTTFTPQTLWEKEGSIGTMGLSFSGPGTLYVDNFRIYANGTDYMDLPASEYAVLADSGMQALRMQGLIGSRWGTNLAGLTDGPGVTSLSGNNAPQQHNLASLLSMLKKAKINPWLQLGMYLSPDEWRGMVEYLAAPYDPAVDTPAQKPWAYRRYTQGQAQPWVNEFTQFYFEISNETWNPLFAPWNFTWAQMTDPSSGRVYAGGEVYGLFQEYVREQMRSSPYWSAALDQKFKWVLGGWTVQTGATGYGQAAASTSPSSSLMTVANYNGGWDEGEAPAQVNDDGFFRVLTFAPQVGIPTALELVKTRDLQAAQGVHYNLGTYEGGPGYSLPNTISLAQEESEARVMKSLAAGTATLDIFLAQAYLGFDVQNFYSFARSRYFWSSHANLSSGGQAYPSWKALSLYNREGLGDFLVTKTVSVPTADLAATQARPAVKGAPLVSSYVTRSGSRYNLFVLSRKLDNYPQAGDDGYTPLTVHLPFTQVSAIKLYKLSGDPRANNLDSDNIQVMAQDIPAAAFNPDFTLNAANGADARGLAPGSIYLYVFDGAQNAPLPAAPLPRIYQAFDQTDPSAEPVFHFSVLFSEPVSGFSSAGVRVGGNTRADYVQVEDVPGSQHMEYNLSVAGMRRGGQVTVSLPAGAAQSVASGASSQDSQAVDNTVTYSLPDGGAEMIFPVLEDSGIQAQAPDLNFFGQDGFWLHGLGWDDFCGYYLKFAPAVFSGFPVSSAKLRMHFISGAPAEAHLFSSSNDWRADQLTFRNAPRPNQDLASGTTQWDVSAWLEFDVTRAVREEVQKDGLISFALTASNYTKWNTAAGDARYRPELVVNYGARSRDALAILTPQPWAVFYMGEATHARLESGGSSGGVHWSLADPAGKPLPPGLTLNEDGSLGGVPQQAGSWGVALRAQDDSQSVEKQLDFVVADHASSSLQMVLGGSVASPYSSFPGLVWQVQGSPRDSAVDGYYPTTNQHGMNMFITSGGRSGYVQYDLSGIPGKILSARAFFYQNYLAWTGTVSIFETSRYYAGTSTPWSETGLTYENAPGPGAMQDSRVIGTDDTWYSWDVTPAARSAASGFPEPDGDKTLSLMLQTDDYVGNLSARESRHDERPFLIITYQPEWVFLPAIWR